MPHFERHDGRVVLITGASRGIGEALARGFARAGAHVVGLARTQGALEALDDAITREGGTCTLIPADLTDGASMARLPAALFDRFGRLDALILNAGVLGDLSPVTDIVPKVWDHVFAINVTANLRLIAGLDPLLRQSDSGRVIGITSRKARAPAAFWGAYGATKAAFEHLVLSYAAETAESRLRINLVDPGPMRTGMRAKAMPGEDPATLPPPDALCPIVLGLAHPSETRHGELIAFPRS